MESPNSNNNQDQDDSPQVSIQKQDLGTQISPAECMPELNAVLAAVIRVFAVRGRAIGEERAKQESLKLQPGGKHQSTPDKVYRANESTTGSEA